jgi:hypothetical protein
LAGARSASCLWLAVRAMEPRALVG